MLKKVNIILIFGVLPLSSKLNMGYSLFIPLFIFYLLKDYKNIYYMGISSLISTIFLMKEQILILVLVMILCCLFGYLIQKIKNEKIIKLSTYIISFFILCINLLSYYLLKYQNYSSIIISSLLSILIYVYLEKYLLTLIKEPNDKISLSILAYMEIIIALIAIISASTQSIIKVNLGFVYATIFAMYFSKKYKDIYSFIYSITAMVIIYICFGLVEALFIPFVSCVYLISNPLMILLFNALITLLIFTNPPYEINYLISIMISCIIFEILSNFMLEEKQEDENIFEYIYSQVQKGTNEEILNFALFLDKFASGFKNPKEFNNRLSEGIKTLVQSHCNSCSKKKTCFDKYKIELYGIFKAILLQEPNFKSKYPEFYTYCEKISNFEHTSKLLETTIKIPSNDSETAQNNIMIAQLNGVSNAIKKYVIELSSRKELSYYKIIQVKKRLEDYGYEITYYEVIKLFVDDFNIKVGIKHHQFKEVKDDINILINNILGINTSIIFINEERGNSYFNIIPKLKLDIMYGYGALSCDGEEICGDNYLIEEINNGHFISAISDGMGKGYRAFYESDLTLRLVENIIKLNLSTGTALEILNSFYAVQEYLEQYATLDFLEINRYTASAKFYKMGASTSYIFKSNGKVEKIYNKSLPFGLDEEITDTIYKLENGDLILMTSDGIFENLVDELSLQKFINGIKNLPPQKIVYELLNYTINNKIKTKDDMSVIALKIQNIA